MGTIADKLSYLNTTKGKIKDSINLTGANIGNNDTFRSYSAKLRDSLVDIINNGTDELYDNFPKATASGTDLTLNNTYQAPMKIALSGNTYQGANPTPSSPQDIEVVTGDNEVEVNGKNLFDGELELGGYYETTSGEKDNRTDRYRNVNPILVKPNTTYTTSINGTVQKYYMSYYRKDKTYISSDDNITGIFSTPSDCYYVNFRCYLSDFTSDFANLKVQLEEGSTPTTYEPYSSDTYEINLGKNLYNKNISQSYKWLYATGELVDSADPNITSNFIKVEKGKQYTISGVPTTTYSIRLNSYTGTTTNTFKTCLINNSTSIRTFTADADYIIFAIGNANATLLTEIQLEQGSQATAYSSYKTPIEMCKIGDYQDEFRRSTGKNLFDKDNANTFSAYFLDTDTTLLSSSVSKCIYIPIESGKTYTISKTASQRFNVATTTTLPSATTTILQNAGNQKVNVTQLNSTKVTITASSTAKYLVVWYYASNADTLTEQQILDSIQIELGSQATEYEPYGIDTWYLHKEIGKVVLDGSENWLDWSTYYSHRRYALDLSSTILPAADNEIGKIIANEYTTASAYNNYRDVQSICIQPSGYIAIYDNTYNSGLNAWKTWLSSNNVITYYALLTPTNTEITDEELISQLNAIKNAMSKKDKTYITAKYVEGNQPFKIVASALLREE